MNIYKSLSVLATAILFLYTSYLENSLLYLAPAFGVSIFFYLYNKDLFKSVAGALLICSVSLLAVYEVFSYLLSMTFIPLSILALEGSFRADTSPNLESLGYRSLNTSSIFLLLLFVVLLIFSSIRFELLIIASAIPIYLLLKYIGLKRRIRRKFQVTHNQIYNVIRNRQVEYRWGFTNQSDSTLLVELPNIAGEGYQHGWRPNKIILKPNSNVKVSIYLDGYLIGSYNVYACILIEDSTRLFRFSRIIEYQLNVKPKLETKLMVARGLLQELGGKGGQSSEMYFEAVFNKARSGLFLGVRHYTPGDTLRDIHFKKSVEHHTLITKEYEYTSLFKPILLVDVSTSSYEDLDDVLSDTIDILMGCVRLGLHDMGLVMYDSNRILIYSIYSNPVSLLMKAIEIINLLRPDSLKYDYILDEPRLYETDVFYFQILYRYYISRLKSTIIGSVISRLLEEVDKESRIVFIKYGSRFRNFYGLVEEVLVRSGFGVLDLSRDKSVLYRELPIYMEV